MWPTILNLGKFQLTYFMLAVVLMIFLFSFFTWRKMRLDYEEEKIFSWTLLTIFVMMVVGLAGFWTINKKIGFWLAISMLSGIYVLRKWSQKHHWDFWEWMDHVGYWMLLIGTVLFFSWGPQMWIYGSGFFISTIIIKILENNYRKIRWYTSGKPGFSGMMAIILIALVEIVAEFNVSGQLYFLGITARQWLAAWLLTGSTVVLYLRGKSKI